MAKILVALFSPESSAKVAQAVKRHGHECSEARQLSDVDKYLNENIVPDLIVAAVEFEDELELLFLESVKNRDPSGKLKILAIVPQGSMGAIENVFKHGIDECLNRPFRMGMLIDKVSSLLEISEERETWDEDLVPPLIRETINTIRDSGRLLGDVCEIFSGIAARDSKARRVISPGSDWTPTLINDSIDNFYVGKEREYYLFRKDMLRRVPNENEYAVPEKVVLKRTISPICAGLDTSGLPYSSELYGIQTVKGFHPGALCCILNSRYANYYFQRYRPPAEGLRGVYISRTDIEGLPIMIPPEKEQKRLVEIARKLCVIPPRPKSPTQAIERGKLLAEANQAVFSLFGFSDEAVALFSASHF